MATGPSTLASSSPRDGSTITVPGRSPRDGYAFLQSVASGSLLGTGSAYLRDLDSLRTSYNQQIGVLGREIDAMRARGLSSAELAAYANAGRNRILLSVRLRQNLGAAVTLDLRDRAQYGIAGRSLPTMLERARVTAARTVPPADINEIVVAGALRSNAGVTGSVARATRFLGRGGAVLSVLGVAAGGYEIYAAKPEDRGRIVAEQAGATATSWAASGGAVALCVVLGVGTGGVGLLAIGLVAGVAGGAAGSWLGDRFYYSLHPRATQQLQTSGWVDQNLFHSWMP